MVTFSIKSLQHPKVKECVSIRTQAKIRRHLGLALIIGHKMVSELAPLNTLIIRSDLDPSHYPPATTTYVVTDSILKKITGLQQPEGVSALIPLPTPTQLDCHTNILVLDHISDPGNLGTLLRTALGLGFDGAYLINCVDPFNDKALRASMGAAFKLPVQFGQTADFLSFLQQASFTGVAATLNGSALQGFKKPSKMALIIGNESHGIDPAIQKICQCVTIPLEPSIESLNAAVAGGILLYALAP